jgi:peptide/nickel transport system substrate-binding protein/microcin C transport system substrate-binding protein
MFCLYGHRIPGFILSFLVSTPIFALPIGNPQAPRGGEIVFQRGSEPTSLNPITSEGHDSVDIQFNVIEPLLRLSEQTQGWRPCLADHWRILNGGRVYQFHIRPDARWSDGLPVTSEDVKFSFDVIFDPHFPTAHMRPYYQGLRSVEIVDAHTVRFNARDSYFGNFISSAGLPIVPKHIYGDVKRGPSLNDNLIGSGPYKISEWEKSVRLVLERNPLWWGLHDPDSRGSYNPDRLVFRFVSQETLALSLLAKEKIDFMPLSIDSYVMKTDGPLWGKRIFKTRVQNEYPKASHFIALNLERPLFRDQRLRRALSLLVDRETMINKFKYGMAVAATGPWYRQSVFADHQIQPDPFDPARALTILRELGWNDRDHDGVLEKNENGHGQKLEFGVLTSNHESERYLTVFQEDAKKAGVKVNIYMTDQSLLAGRIERRDYDALDVSWGGGLVDFDPMPMWHSRSIGPGGNNFSGYRDKDVDRLIEKARHTPERSKRIPVMREIYRRIARAVPCLFILNEDSEFYAFSARVGRPRPTFRYEVGTRYWWVIQ